LLEKEKLNRANYIDWYRNLRIVLTKEKTKFVLTEPYPEDLPTGLSAANCRAYEKQCDDVLNVSCLMLTTMVPDLQKQYEHVDAYTMIHGLCGMFENQVRTERYNISKALFACKLAEGSPVSPHVIKMMGYLETVNKLGCELKDDLATDVIIQSLPTSYEYFHMNGIEKTVAKLYGMLKTDEDNIKKNPNHIMMVQKKKKKRKCWTPPKGNSKKKIFDEPSSSKPKTKSKSDPSPDEECFHYYKKGHWFRNYKKCFEEQKTKKRSETSISSGINVIEINITVSSTDSWVFDTRLMIHTCKSLQGLSLTRIFAKGELDVRVGNGAKVAAIAVGTYHLSLSSGLVFELNNCYCIPTLCKNIISSSCLEEVDGYEIIIKNKRCSIYYNDIFYNYCPLVNGL
jgi:hypothetical protein